MLYINFCTQLHIVPVGCVCLILSLLFCVGCLCNMCHSPQAHELLKRQPTIAETEALDTDSDIKTNGTTDRKSKTTDQITPV